MRRNLQRYKLRRDVLIELLKKSGLFLKTMEVNTPGQQLELF